MKIAIVALSGAAREFDRLYHYAVTEDLDKSVVAGVRVIVPFGGGNSLKEGYVVGITENTDLPALKNVKRVIDDEPVLSEKMIRLALWMKDRYICTVADAMKCMLPAGTAVKSRAVACLTDKGRLKCHDSEKEGGKEGGEEGSIKKGHKKVLLLLAEYGGECDCSELRKKAKIKGFQLIMQELAETGHILIREEYTEAVKEKHVRAACLSMPAEQVMDDIENGRISKIQHIRALEMLAENGKLPLAELKRFAGITAGSLNSLARNGYIGFCDMEVSRDPYKDRFFEKTEPLPPTGEQEQVINDVKALMDEGRYAELLVHGVTGSGKTEVYLQLIDHAIQRGRQAIVLVPEISLTPQMVERFKQRFGDLVAVQHSRLSLGERFDQWQLIKKGKVKVAVGARSAVFSPFDNLGIIIVDEEHEESYKSDTTPKYRAHEIAEQRCREDGAVLLYGSATPSGETYYRAEKGCMLRYELKARINNQALPQVKIADMRKELENGNRSLFSDMLSHEISKNIKNKEQTLLFINRRGYAPFVLCRSCGYAMKCGQCSIALTYHANSERLICHQCGYTEKMPETCPKCGSTYIRHFGTGTQRVEEEIKKKFPDCSVIRMDMDTTRGKNSHEDILREFREKSIDILVGTQMIAKGHDFPNVTLVGILAADSLLNINDYRASERTFQLLTQAAGRAGRDKLPGRVIIQTYNTEDYSIQAAARHDYLSFYKQEIKVRESLGYPPFTSIGSVTISSVNDRLAYKTAGEIAGQIKSLACQAGIGEEAVLGPVRAPVAKISNRFRWRILIKCEEKETLIKILTSASDMFRAAKGGQQVEMSIDINPSNML